MYKQTAKQLRRILIGISGGFLLIVGIIAIPYPGPGWLIVFTALAILSTEFLWAKRILHFAKGKYDAWQVWIKAQNLWVQGFFLSLTCAVVVFTLWLLNAYGYIASYLEIEWGWIRSPLF